MKHIKCAFCGGAILGKGKKYCCQSCYFSHKKQKEKEVDVSEIDLTSVEISSVKGGTVVCCPLCGWEGKSLGVHLYGSHGIRADDFKEAAGLTRSGLITKELSESLAERPQVLKTIEQYKGKEARGSFKDKGQKSSKRKPGREAIERRKKSAKETREKFVGLTTSCSWCGKRFTQNINTIQQFCSVKCRSKKYRNKVIGTVVCSVCGEDMPLTYSKKHSSSKTERYVCSLHCRQSLAGKIARAKDKEKKP